MAITKEFEDAVSNGDKLLVRIMLKDIMLIDTTLKKFDEMLTYAERRMDCIYDVHDDEILLQTQAKWTKEYLNNQMVAVVNNFSKERIELLRKMVQFLYPNKKNENAAHGLENKSIHAAENSSWTLQKKVGTGMAIAGTAATIGGVAASEGILIVGGIGVAAVGIGLILTDKG